ncbi:MAG: WYL domain-containing protein [Alphaproteobacteria bacterium]|nr:WYL domain-containing protein [Alphaproteobacteria bacterium]
MRAATGRRNLERREHMSDVDPIFARLERLTRTPPPPGAGGFAVHVPVVEADDGQEEEGCDLLDVVGLALGIVYQGASGQETRRRITVSSLVSRGDAVLVNAWCHERQAFRQFRLDRIGEVVVLATGEVFDDAAAFFDGLHGRDPTAEALAGCRHSLQILAYLARCDGHLHPDEQEQIIDFILSTAPDPSCLDEVRLRRHVAALYPDPATYAKALRALRLSGGDQVRRLGRYVQRVLDADGILDDAEFEAALQAQTELSRCPRG